MKTVSLETAKKLKEAGFPQETFSGYVCYVEPRKNNPTGTYKLGHGEHSLWCPSEYDIAAPTTDELLEELPYSLRYSESDYWFQIQKLKHGGYDVRYTDADHQNVKKYIQNDTVPEALAAMWLWLKSEGMLK